MKGHSRYQRARNVTLIGAACNTLLGISKLLGGYLFHSHALVADGIHSFSDLLTDAMVLFASKVGSHDADASHPYGHQRIETAATLFLSLLLILAGAGIAWDAIDELFTADHTVPGFWALPIIVFSIVINEILFHYTHYVGKQIQSELLLANAWHHRSDAASSIVVLLGLLGAMAGLIYLDAMAAVVVGFLIIKMGWDYGWNSVKELIDTAIAAEQLQHIEQIIQQVDGVEKIHQLRSRSMGGDIFIDVHILVAPRISVSEGHYIAQHVHDALLNKVEKVKDVTVHVDPEDDELNCPSMHLPSRKKLEQSLIDPLRQQFPQLTFWNMHYEDGRLAIDLVFAADFKKSAALKRSLTPELLGEHHIYELRIMHLDH